MDRFSRRYSDANNGNRSQESSPQCQLPKTYVRMWQPISTSKIQRWKMKDEPISQSPHQYITLGIRYLAKDPTPRRAAKSRHYGAGSHVHHDERQMLFDETALSPDRLKALSSPRSMLGSPLSPHNESDVFIDHDGWKHFNYKYTHLAMSGGGSRGYAYIGSIKALEEANLLSKMTHFVGSSAGSIIVSMAAIGCDSQDMADFFSCDFLEFYKEPVSWWKLPFVRLFKRFAMFSLSGFNELLGDLFQRKTGYRDYTFRQLYDDRGVDLAVTVTNLTLMRSEYCHYTTTPHVPIRMAIKISIAAPGLFESVKTDELGNGTCVYVDGGALENYPVRYYDDVDPVTGQRKYNEETLGFFLMSEDQFSHKLWYQIFGINLETFPSYIPDTKIARARIAEEIKVRKKKMKSFNEKEYLTSLEVDPYTIDGRAYRRHFDISERDLCEINGPLHYMNAMVTTLLLSQKHSLVQCADARRTVAINCGYLRGGDYKFEPDDREFLIRQGYEQTIDFLMKHVLQNLPHPQPVTPLARRYSFGLHLTPFAQEIWGGRRRSSYQARHSIYQTPMANPLPKVAVIPPSDSQDTNRSQNNDAQGAERSNEVHTVNIPVINIQDVDAAIHQSTSFETRQILDVSAGRKYETYPSVVIESTGNSSQMSNTTSSQVIVDHSKMQNRGRENQNIGEPVINPMFRPTEVTTYTEERELTVGSSQTHKQSSTETSVSLLEQRRSSIASSVFAVDGTTAIPVNGEHTRSCSLTDSSTNQRMSSSASASVAFVPAIPTGPARVFAIDGHTAKPLNREQERRQSLNDSYTNNRRASSVSASISVNPSTCAGAARGSNDDTSGESYTDKRRSSSVSASIAFIPASPEGPARVAINDSTGSSFSMLQNSSKPFATPDVTAAVHRATSHQPPLPPSWSGEKQHPSTSHQDSPPPPNFAMSTGAHNLVIKLDQSNAGVAPRKVFYKNLPQAAF